MNEWSSGLTLISINPCDSLSQGSKKAQWSARVRLSFPLCYADWNATARRWGWWRERWRRWWRRWCSLGWTTSDKLTAFSSFVSRTYTRVPKGSLYKAPIDAGSQARKHARTNAARDTNARTYTYIHLTRHSEVRWKPRTLLSESIESLHRPASGHLRSAMTICVYIYVYITRVFIKNNAFHNSRLGSPSWVIPSHAPPTRDDEEDQEDIREIKDRFEVFWWISSMKLSGTSSARNLAPLRLILTFYFFVIALFLTLVTFSVSLFPSLFLSFSISFLFFLFLKYHCTLSPVHFPSTRLSFFALC